MLDSPQQKNDIVVRDGNNLKEEYNEYMEEIKEEYKGLELGDQQIIQLKSLGITPEQAKQLIEAAKMMAEFTEVFNRMVELFRKSDVMETMKRLGEAMAQFNTQLEDVTSGGRDKRNKKGKQIKPWQKKNFYEGRKK